MGDWRQRGLIVVPVWIDAEDDRRSDPARTASWPEGEEAMTSEYRDEHEWHAAINRYHEALRKTHPHPTDALLWPHRAWMYEAKKMAAEIPHMQQLFEKERTGQLAKTHRQCSHAEREAVHDNHLTCCLGVECRACPELQALEKANVSPDATDRMKAWTCATHIAFEGGDVSNEGYLLTEDDKIFWQRTYANMAGSMQPEDE